MKRTTFILPGILLMAILCSCGGQVTESSSPVSTENETLASDLPAVVSDIEKSLVQVWNSESLMSTGVVVGDGNYMLTVLNWESVIWENVDIVIADGERYTASVQAIDPRTGVTLLSVPGLNVPPAATGEYKQFQQEQRVQARWYRQTYQDGVIGSPQYYTTDLVIGTDALASRLVLQAGFPPESLPDIMYPGLGAILTDTNGAVLGLLMPDYMDLFPHPHGYGMLPGFAGIGPALELLLPGYAEKPYTDGPLMMVVTNEKATAIHHGYFENYEAVNTALHEILGQAGGVLDDEELPGDYYAIREEPEDGNTVTFVFTLPVVIAGSDGIPLTHAKWVCIHWDRPGDGSAVLYYGSGKLELEGGLSLAGNLSALLDAIDPLAYHALGN